MFLLLYVAVCVHRAYPVYCRVLCTCHNNMYPDPPQRKYTQLWDTMYHITPAPLNCSLYIHIYEREFEPGGSVPFFFFFKQKTAYEIGVRLVGSEMCIRDRCYTNSNALLFVRTACCSFCCARAAYALILKSSDHVSYSSRFIFRHRKKAPASFWYHTYSSKKVLIVAQQRRQQCA